MGAAPIKRQPHSDSSFGSELVATGVFGACSRRCRTAAIGRRLLVAAAGLTVVLLYCATAPPILWRRDRSPYQPVLGPGSVVLVTGDRPGGEPISCVRQLSPTVENRSDDTTQQIKFLAGVKSPCWLQKILEEDFEYLQNSSVQLGNKKKGLIKIHKRAELYAWYARRSTEDGVSALRVRCLPYAYVIGQPKCGTTDLRYRLSLHPRVASRGAVIGGHWWSRRRFPAPSTDPQAKDRPVSFREYLDTLELVAHRLVGGDCRRARAGRPSQTWTPSSQLIAVDGSTSTMWDGVGLREARRSPQLARSLYPPLRETVAAGVAALQPAARIVAILREPADRLFSDYLYFKPERDDEKSPEEFHRMSQIAVELWRNCTRGRAEHDCATDRRLTGELEDQVRLHVGLYAVYLQHWLEAFDRDQVLVLRTEDYKRNITEGLGALFNHLDIGLPTESAWETIRTTARRNERRKSFKHQTMLPETRQLLRDFYRPYNRRLARLLRSDRFLWEDVSETR